jgi:DNA-binding NarL/FixJ family response regulator
MQFEALSQFDHDDSRVALFDRIIRDGPWQLATLDGLLVRNPVPFSAVLVHDRGAALDLTIERIAQGGRPIAVIGYSEAIEPARVVDAMHAGAVDYIAWPPDPATLPARLRIAAGRADRRLNDRRTIRAARSSFERLSDRERQVLGALANGDSTKEIGRKLGISPRTVEIHRAHVLDKLGANNSIQAAVMAVKAELFS